MDRHAARVQASAFGQGEDSSLVFFGGGGADFAYMQPEGAVDALAAEERSKYLGEPGSLAATRRRVVRRPLGSGSYQAQSIVFSERDRDSPSLASSEPLGELLQQLAASRKHGMPRGAARESGGGLSGSSVLSSLSGLVAEGTERRRAADAAAVATPAQQKRAIFVQELMLSALSQPVDKLDYGPLDQPPVKPK